MFIILYRWRINPEKEAQFIAAWSEITAFYRENFDSLGSRLHRGSDGLFYAYAQWESAEAREKAFQNFPQMDASEKMKDALEKSFPEVRLDMAADYLIWPEGR